MTDKESFEKAVRQRMIEKNISFALALYQILDESVVSEIERAGIVLACKRGCSLCCNQMIVGTEIELVEIIRFIRSLPRAASMPLLKRIRNTVNQWRDYFSENEFLLKTDPFKAYTDWRGRPCPFLNEQRACDIYPVRVIDCRTASSLIVCGSGAEAIPDQKRFRFPPEIFANNLMLDGQERISGPPAQVIPLPHWLLMMKKSIY